MTFTDRVLNNELLYLAGIIVVFCEIHSVNQRRQWLITTIYSGRNRNCLQYIPRNMHTVFALLCFVVVIHWLIFPYPSGLLHWHCGNLTIATVPAKQPWWIWINTPCEFIMNDFITTTKQSTTKPCAYFLGYTVPLETRLLFFYFDSNLIEICPCVPNDKKSCNINQFTWACPVIW